MEDLLWIGALTAIAAGIHRAIPSARLGGMTLQGVQVKIVGSLGVLRNKPITKILSAGRLGA